MARNKTIFKEDILEAAQQFLIEKSVKELTARALSKYMNISTQPLYAEFQNMNALRTELFDTIYDKLENELLVKQTHEDPIINLSLNYISFACKNPKLIGTIYLEQNGSTNTSINDFSYNLFRRIIKDSPVYSKLTEEQVHRLLTGTWVFSTGFANLIASGNISSTETEIITFLKATIHDVLKMDILK